MPATRPAASSLADYAAFLRESILFIVDALRRSWLLVLVITMLGAGCGLAMWYARPAYFESELVCQYINQPGGKKAFGEMAHKLGSLAQSRSYQELGRQLGIGPAAASKILHIEGRNRSGSQLHEDITEEYQPLYFKVQTLDRSIFPAVERGLLEYLGTNTYQRRMSVIQNRRLSVQIAELQGDLVRIDSLLAAYAGALRRGMWMADTSGSGNAFNPRNMLEYRASQEERMVNLERLRSLDSGDVIKPMHHFVPADRPGRGSKKIIAAWLIGAFLLSTGLAIVRSNPRPADA